MASKRFQKLQYYYTYFNIFPVVVIIQNLSFYFFPFLAYNLISRGNRLFKTTNFIDTMCIFMAVGAVLSTLASIVSPIEGSFANSMIVLPNYLYWLFIIILFGAYARQLDYLSIYKATFWGFVSTIAFFFIVPKSITSASYILRSMQQNSFSFILICFSPMVVHYIEQKYSRLWAILGAIGIVAAGALSGSRSGSVLTVLTCFLTLFSNRINLVRLLGFGLLIGVIMPLVMQLQVTKNTIRALNERTYDLIYNADATLNQDQSYLIRLAQVEKGLAIFRKHPIIGIGLNNYGEYRYDIKADFEGGEIIRRESNIEIDTLSAQNSYLSLLAEGGLMLFIPFILILLGLFTYFVRNFNKIHDFQKPFFWGMIGMCVHLYVISAILNVFAWLLIGLAAATIKYNKEVGFKATPNKA